jgi:hypothetical protein
MYTYTIVGGGGGALPPTSPLPLNTCSHNIATRRPPHATYNNTQQHTRTPNNREQHTTTVHNSTRVHKITNVPQFLKQRDINSNKLHKELVCDINKMVLNEVEGSYLKIHQG